MHLSPHEVDRLLVAAAADLARRRLERGARLGATEAAALVIDEVHEMAWDGVALDEVIDRARRVLAPEQVLPGVAGMVDHLQVDALFPAGSFLVDVVEPIGPSTGPTTGDGPPRELNAGRPRRELTAVNEARYTIRVTSHVDMSKVNRTLRIEDGPVRGWRLDIPAGSSLAWAPGERRTVTVVTWDCMQEGDSDDGVS
jgi:urease subunit gamma/beta